MRFFAALAALCALTQIALAQTPECKAISDSATRLACYDKKAPAASAAKPPSRPDPASKIDSAKYVDTISAEDVLMNARLKNICRGC
jgi:hypothetical protein